MHGPSNATRSWKFLSGGRWESHGFQINHIETHPAQESHFSVSTNLCLLRWTFHRPLHTRQKAERCSFGVCVATCITTMTITLCYITSKYMIWSTNVCVFLQDPSNTPVFNQWCRADLLTADPWMKFIPITCLSINKIILGYEATILIYQCATCCLSWRFRNLSKYVSEFIIIGDEPTYGQRRKLPLPWTPSKLYFTQMYIYHVVLQHSWHSHHT